MASAVGTAVVGESPVGIVVDSVETAAASASAVVASSSEGTAGAVVASASAVVAR